MKRDSRGRRFTKIPLVRTSFMQSATDAQLLRAAAAERGISQSEAIRLAVRGFAHGVLQRHVPDPARVLQPPIGAA